MAGLSDVVGINVRILDFGQADGSPPSLTLRVGRDEIPKRHRETVERVGYPGLIAG